MAVVTAKMRKTSRTERTEQKIKINTFVDVDVLVAHQADHVALAEAQQARLARDVIGNSPHILLRLLSNSETL